MNPKEISGGSRVERKKEETRQKIITIAMDLFKRQGVNATTMEQIARDVDIAKGTLYNYFPVKEAIISEYIRRSFGEQNPARILHIQQMPDTRTRMVMILNELMEGVRSQPEIFEKYLVYQIKNMISLRRDAGVKSGFELLAAEVIVLGQKNAEIRDDLPLALLVDMFEFAFIEVAQRFYLEPEKFNASGIIEQCVDLCLDGARDSSPNIN